MDENPSGTKRRVYDLPQELVDRILEFQRDRGLPSEVEAARRLLDQALKARDTEEALVGRYYAALNASGDPTEAAKVVLVGHPLVRSLRFHDESIEFEFEKEGKSICWLHPRANNEVIRGNQTLRYDASRGPGQRLFDPDDIPF